MAARSLRVPYQTFLDQNAKHSKIANALPGLKPALQKALAELVLIRLSDDLQEAIAGMAYRLACATPYIDATTPSLLTDPARSGIGARGLFETYGRTKYKYVKWSKTSYIRETVKHVIHSGDPFVTVCDTHSLLISEMQTVRNRIAHRNTATRKQFDIVLRRYYGGAPKSVTPGLLLIAPKVSVPPLQRYLVATRILVRDCAKG